jgi:hypothetical protein
MQNQITPDLFIAGNSFEYNNTKYTIVPGDTLTSMAKAISILTGTTVSLRISQIMSRYKNSRFNHWVRY